MKRLAIVALSFIVWMSIGITSQYLVEVKINNNQFTRGDLLMGSVFGPVVTIVLVFESATSFVPDCLANCKEEERHVEL